MHKFAASEISKVFGAMGVHPGFAQPELDAVFSRWPLYEEVDDWSGVPGGLLMWVWRLLAFASSVDLYCPRCRSISVFNHAQEGDHPGKAVADSKVPEYDLRGKTQIKLSAVFVCARSHGSHLAWVDLLLTEKSITKTGQYPSLADIAQHGLEHYRKVLGDERQRELNMAVGLNAHGVGIGALIYLRRALEYIVASAEQIAVAENGGNPIYSTTDRMADKIKALSKHLPDLIVEQRNFYGILSDGFTTGANTSARQCSHHVLMASDWRSIRWRPTEKDANEH